MQLGLVVSNGEGKESFVVSLQHIYVSVLVLLVQLQHCSCVTHLHYLAALVGELARYIYPVV
jgi:hypothetical protein